MLSFQEIIATLNEFWQERGCVIHQPYDVETGAGTFNPATFLRSLGPEPYSTGYVEPSRRPQDGRYAENPNRVQLFHQYQVIIKPSPFDIQQTYLDSLKALGLPLEDHDIRFVCDDWESPTLGAWGLGWEVWIDGMEATQFTYFQAVGSLPLHPIPIEITYGLERLAMYLQGVDSIFDVKYNDELTFGDITRQGEIEWSHYNFQEASTEIWARHFADYEKEAEQLVEKLLPFPAYDFVLKASHAFNILDARGVISVTERAGYIARIRHLARAVAECYLEKREKEGFPLLKPVEKPQIQPLPPPPSFSTDAKHPYLLEILSEELPPTYAVKGKASLAKQVISLLDKHEIPYGQIKTYATHRRVVLYIEDLSTSSPETLIEKKGPQLDVAFDQAGNLSPQGKGFFRSIGLDEITREQLSSTKELEVRTIKSVDYLFASVKKKSTDTATLLSENLPKIIENLDFPKKMIWNSLDFPYPRPIHSIISLFGKEIIPFCVANITADRMTAGHRQHSPEEIQIPSPKEYLDLLRQQRVLVDPEERTIFLVAQLEEKTKKHSLTLVEQQRVINEVLYLSEFPEVTSAQFDAAFLEVPPEVLISEMIEHQRYFPCQDSTGELTNTFFVACDRTPTDLIRKGNERVLSARLSDGAFLYAQDKKRPLEEWNENLKKMTFYKDLGTVYEKVQRIAKHAQSLHDLLPIGNKKELVEAAMLCKADLATDMVGEFPQLQGTMGCYIALEQNKPEAVACAIEEHWMPRGENSALPSSPAGALLSLADRFDNLLGYFAIGLKPSSSADPFALRRQAIGVIKILLSHPLDIRSALTQCQKNFPTPLSQNKELVDEILHFLTGRAKSVFLEQGLAKDEIEACLGKQGCCNPYEQLAKIRALRTLREKSGAFDQLAEVYKRAKGQLKQATAGVLSPDLCKEPQEKELFTALEELEKNWSEITENKNYLAGFEHLAALQPKIAALFDHIKILDDNAKLQANRLALLQKVCDFCDQLLDLSKLQISR